MADQLQAIGAIFFAIIVIGYLIIFFLQYTRYIPGTERLVVLTTRVSLFLPLYALFMYASLVKPEILPAMTVPSAIVEGYSFYCFFTLIVTNLGGPAKSVIAFKGTGKELACCNCCCPSDHDKYYKKTTWALFHFLFTRTLVVTIGAIAFYTKSNIGKAVNAILSIVAVVILFYSLLHLVLFYENVYNSCTNLFGIFKFTLLKFSVGLIVLQGLVQQFMVVAGAEPYDDDDAWSAADQTQRGYCILVLLEFVILTLPYIYTFAYQITPLNPNSMKTTVERFTFCSFLGKVLSVTDVFGYLTLIDDDLQVDLAANGSLIA